MAGQIFNGNINGLATAWMMIYMLVFAVAWEGFTGWLEKLTEENKAHSEMLNKVGRELIILGFIAFAVILCKELGVLHWNNETLHVFEFCDLLVSITVLIYVANCAISSMTMSGTQRAWDRIAMTQTADIMEDVTRYIKSLETSPWRRFWKRLPIVGNDWRIEVDFKILQLLFETKFHMPVQFDYVVYIKLVLQNIVVSMANISLWHWVLIMAINGLWWLTIKLLLPAFDKEGTPDDHICLFEAKCGPEVSAGAHRRLAAAAAGAAEQSACREKLVGDYCTLSLTGNKCALNATLEQALNATGPSNASWGQCGESAAASTDISSNDTFLWLCVFIVIGWLIAVLQASIVIYIDSRTSRVLAYNGAAEDTTLTSLLATLQKELVQHEQAAQQSSQLSNNLLDLEDNDDEASNVAEVGDLHHRHLVNLGHGTEHQVEVDHIMLFKQVGKSSNDVMSIRSFESLIFLTQFLQLVLDFYIGFYMVHMRQRVPLGYGHSSMSDGHFLSQLLCHVAILLPILITMYLLMIMTRKIALLIGVLHLNEDAVSHVLQHMEIVKSMRRRIQDTLVTTKVVHGTPDPQGAAKLLETAGLGEVAMLQVLSGRDSARIDRAEMRKIAKDHEEFTTFNLANLDKFLSRDSFRTYELLDPSHQSTAQTSHTLLCTDTEDASSDTVAVEEFCVFVTRYVAEIMDLAIAKNCPSAELAKFNRSLRQLGCVDDRMFGDARRLARIKAMFRATDANNNGSISRSELFTALRRFKVPITRKEFKEIYRVLDPDQSHSTNLDEWVDFMVLTDQGSDLQTRKAVRKEAKYLNWKKSQAVLAAVKFRPKKSRRVYADAQAWGGGGSLQQAPETSDATTKKP